MLGPSVFVWHLLKLAASVALTSMQSVRLALSRSGTKVVKIGEAAGGSAAFFSENQKSEVCLALQCHSRKSS